MPQVIALLRGINVGKAKRIAMADLRDLLADLGYTEPRTLLNSGNAVFGCTAAQARSAPQRIERGVAEHLGVKCAVMTRTADELVRIIEQNPIAEGPAEPSRYLVGFLSEALPAARVAELEQADYGEDQLRLRDDTAYLWCAAGVLSSPLSKLAWSKLGVDVTTRNWTTVLKLAELATKHG